MSDLHEPCGCCGKLHGPEPVKIGQIRAVLLEVIWRWQREGWLDL